MSNLFTNSLILLNSPNFSNTSTISNISTPPPHVIKFFEDLQEMEPNSPQGYWLFYFRSYVDLLHFGNCP